jgi:ABC-type uncharacterized transport system auxiliary subunit
MKIKPLMFACVSVAALLTTSCGKVRYPNYYTLSLAPTMAPHDNGGRRLGSVKVRDFETPPYLRQGRIAYRETPTQVGYYDYHRWVTNPGATVTAAIIGGLRSSGLFSEVHSDATHMKADFLLTGQLERLDEIDYGGGVRVEVKMSAQVIDLRTKATVWSSGEAETARVEKVGAKKVSVNSVVIEMSNAAQKCIDRLLADMQQKLGGALQPSTDSQSALRVWKTLRVSTSAHPGGCYGRTPNKAF